MPWHAKQTLHVGIAIGQSTQAALQHLRRAHTFNYILVDTRNW